jgi:26S proteasome regulatory subunit N1
MTSVPKPLKFLRPLYPTMKDVFESWPASDTKVSIYFHFRNF